MRIEEYLNSLQKKELIYLFLSIPIVVFIVYYNFVYPDMQKENHKLIKKYKKEKKSLMNIAMQIRKVKNSKKNLTPTLKKLENLQEDYKFIKYSFNSIELIQLSDDKIYNILSKLLEKSKQLNLNTSFNIDWNVKHKPFNKAVNISISGTGIYLNIIKYLQYIEHLQALVNVKNTKITIPSKENIIDSFIEQQKGNLNTISFILTKYKNKDLEYIKSLAKSNNVSLDISVTTSNLLKIVYKGNYNDIKRLYRKIQNNAKTKKLYISSLKAKLYKPKQQSYTKQQNFTINLQIVGESW